MIRKKEIVELIGDCATGISADIGSALAKARKREDGLAREILGTILENVSVARSKSRPMCQDTGVPVFYVTTPPGVDQLALERAIKDAVSDATDSVPLRRNSVDTLTDRNFGVCIPVIHFGQWDKKRVRVELMLKGGGSENITRLYKLPDPSLKAGRDLDGVARCVLDAVYRAQGRGCPPYIIGVGVGGLTDTALALSKRELLRGIGDKSKDRRIRGLEESLLKKVNALGIGPMGLGGKTTALVVKVGFQPRHPASYFVAVSFSCWACRRCSLEAKL